ncbi:uncharacterized protein [Aegilops tauschii subsp. strangulata]|uniref:uncharacterized protein n=1 Tax=Aegilops tauschii subsp. strangulata TaxID=200361 RepID=UPI003CC87378
MRKHKTPTYDNDYHDDDIPRHVLVNVLKQTAEVGIVLPGYKYTEARGKYGPYLTSMDHASYRKRSEFLEWFRDFHVTNCPNWLVTGDFNYLRYPQDRNRDGGSISDMLAFNEAINHQALVEIPLKGRKFTWSNMQDAPLLEKLDWCFTSEAWTLAYPSTIAILLFENHWLLHHDFKDLVSRIWTQEVTEKDSAKRIAVKLKRLRKGIKIWAKNKSDLKKIIENSNFMILCYDAIEEFRPLSTIEANGRYIVKAHLAKILEHQRIYWKQRATIRQIQVGEANTKYFQEKATVKFRHNSIAMLKDEAGNEHHDHNAKAAILFRAFKERLGTSVTTQNPLLLHHLLQQHEDLHTLENPFTKEEIDKVVKEMPNDKSPGPDGFNAAFTKHCWDIIAEDFYTLIQEFYNGTVNLQSINYSFVTLIPKSDDGCTQLLLDLFLS